LAEIEIGALIARVAVGVDGRDAAAVACNHLYLYHSLPARVISYHIISHPILKSQRYRHSKFHGTLYFENLHLLLGRDVNLISLALFVEVSGSVVSLIR
jgi:hypothetical protein